MQFVDAGFRRGGADGAGWRSVAGKYGSRESLPVSTDVAISAIEEVVAPAHAAEVYNLSGLRVRTDKALKSGVYVIDGQKSVVK